MAYRYDCDPGLKKLADSLRGIKIKHAKVNESDYSGSCVLRMILGDGRVVEVGVSGNLHDEAYFVFGEVKR